MARHAVVFLAVVALLFVASSCDSGCTPTTMEAREGAVLDLTDLGKSSVLEARLTGGEGDALEAKQVEFFVRYTDPVSKQERQKLVGEGKTNADGVASTDLKKVSLDIVRLAVEEVFLARFDGDSELCSSDDEANLRVVRAPGAPVPSVGSTPAPRTAPAATEAPPQRVPRMTLPPLPEFTPPF